MQTIKIYSDTPIDNLTIKNIIDIFKVSKCPNESMFFSIENFKGFDGKNILLGAGDRFLEVIYVDET